VSTDKVVEKIPPFKPRAGDRFTEGGNNTLIVFGTDRAAPGPASVDDGLGTVKAEGGGRGTGAVHVVVGRKQADPDFSADDTFLYLSQKTDADDNLEIVGIEESSKSRPAAIIKSTDIRLGTKGNLKIYFDDKDKNKYNFLNGSKSVLSLTEGSTVTVEKDAAIIKVGESEIKIDSGGNVTMKAKEVQVDAKTTTIKGDVNVQGNVQIKGGDVIADGTSLKTHTHAVAGVTAGGATVPSGPPV
jgi:hypothetical protein